MTMTHVAAVLLLGCLARGAALAQTPGDPANADYHFQYLNRLDPAEGWHRTVSGLRYRKVSGSAEGPRPTVSDTVTIHYVGRFIDGSEFDSSVARGEPATFPLGGLIRGWQEGVPMMAVGDRYEFAIPYTLAYGPNGRGPIPGGATLIFTIDLLGIGGQAQ
ncbi:FKBP-type peptidyl-prolyl cis-trans isomerase [Sphingosinicella sp. LHD-64]|uniref:FKBP-type peptidyl-prolyl cis-trans isomerase n=1 Tax=Sphingosinicella sp. LHD-64 TaxID=3072139 RepID=UPI00280F3A64|nr:FKBP-type peptidyl-prolyl cis-trans isomerase [Sphingosinicella sp. LHD-64]MDQ8755052.1 FKBP-type peptidyl-prolyl cis-trans isomerase [Sphingosinicella sp. LHD-64]